MNDKNEKHTHKPMQSAMRWHRIELHIHVTAASTTSGTELEKTDNIVSDDNVYDDDPYDDGGDDDDADKNKAIP